MQLDMEAYALCYRLDKVTTVIYADFIPEIISYCNSHMRSR